MSQKGKSLLARFEEIFSSSCLIVMTVLIAVQVFSRYVLEYSFEWSEELARYLFIWAVYVGCSYATKEDKHLEVTIFRTIAGGRLAKPVTLLSYAFTAVFCFACAWWGYEMIQFLVTTGQKTPALEIKMYWVFLSLPFGMLLMGLRTIERMIGIVTGKIDPVPSAEV
ncbi:TRAP transporter small permease [Halodesulfovibrio marinisediminis]|uniref:Tripartite ATP-independent transporter, DctQ component n=1 Tax=Halodesulfovibrio marinisediminis DSM 17456 TaxID=1121457 RepID=A0A1N6J8I7_9BACT|nr:TRAP transporter small permease [Halodesulfovibrio marinisediminis]SIO40678.1 Tripartite ATP-independent transporter, DctQ component [Halodesulfovibrio marinisediminis DSM 17456]